MKDLCDTIERINTTMRDFGFDTPLCLKNEMFKITESEVIMTIPITLTVKIPKSDLDTDSLSDAVSRAISQSVSRNK